MCGIQLGIEKYDLPPPPHVSHVRPYRPNQTRVPWTPARARLAPLGPTLIHRKARFLAGLLENLGLLENFLWLLALCLGLLSALLELEEGHPNGRHGSSVDGLHSLEVEALPQDGVSHDG